MTLQNKKKKEYLIQLFCESLKKANTDDDYENMEDIDIEMITQEYVNIISQQIKLRSKILGNIN